MSTQTSATAQKRFDSGPPKISLGVVGWLRKNLFSTWYNSLLSLLAMWIVYKAVSAVVMWGVVDAAFGITPASCKVVDGACWSFIANMWPLFMVGPYPFEDRWRPALLLFLIAGLALAAFIPAVRRSRVYLGLWIVSPIVVFLLVRGASFLDLPVVDTTLWGGLMLTLILAVVGIVFSFPIGILLALGRRSRKMPIVRALSVAYIELIRGVPLITILFMASVLFPLFFPDGFDLDKVLRAMIGIILFEAAYLAEIVRGGLQAIPKGQEEAASAVGLNYWQTMVFIVMPQALRIVIPPLVSTFIALLKDTSLVTIIGLFDLLAIAALATANPQWLGQIVEAYVFVAVIYWVICFSISRYSIHLEHKFKTGHQ